MMSIAVALIFLAPSHVPAAPLSPFPDAAAFSADPAAARRQIQAALDAMAKAVLAGDAQAYLATVAAPPARASFFTVEQTEWAKDLAKPETRPVAFAASVTADGAVEGDRWVGPVRFAWTMPTTGEAKTSKDASVEFEVLMTRDGQGDWKYAGEAMETLDADPKTTHAAIFHPKGAKTPAQQIAKAFPIAKAHVDEFFGKAIDRVEEIRLYDRRDVLQFSVYPSMFQTDTTLSGWSESGQTIKFLTNYARDERGWTAAFAHEYGHVATWNLGEKAAAMPWWVQEGIAELAAETYTGGRARIDPIIIAWARRNGLATWDELADYRKTPQDKRRHPYHQGHHMVGFIHDTHGREKCIAWIAAMAKGRSVDEATREALGQPFADLDRAWRDHVAALVAKSEASAPAAQPPASEKK